MSDPRILNATSLDDLLETIREIDLECHESDTDPATVYDVTALPTFGGSEPGNTTGIWSWDAERLLVGSCVADMEIVPR